MTNSLLASLRKEVIQPHLPIRLPCYDFTPVIGSTFGSSLPAVITTVNSRFILGYALLCFVTSSLHITRYVRQNFLADKPISIV